MRYSKEQRTALFTAIVRDYLGSEMPISAACLSHGVPHSTFITWCDRNAAFAKDFDRACSERRDRRRANWQRAATEGLAKRLTGYTAETTDTLYDGDGKIISHRVKTQHIAADGRLAADVLTRFDVDFRTIAEAAAEMELPPTINVHHAPSAPPQIVFQLADGADFDNPKPRDNE